jgi:hypothetical protein
MELRLTERVDSWQARKESYPQITQITQILLQAHKPNKFL